MRNPLRRRTVVPHHEIVVRDLAERDLPSYFVCLEDESSEMQEAGDHKAGWYREMADEGLRVKVAVDDGDRPIAMIQYVPIERSPMLGEGLYVILCIWVHGYRSGVGDVQGAGIGTALLTAAEDDARSLGATGMAAWGLRLPVWMRSSWFKNHGYRSSDRDGARELVWKPFTDDAHEPSWPVAGPVPVGDPDSVKVVSYLSGWCPAANLVHERARRASDELGAQVDFTTVDTKDHDTFVSCGHSDAVFVDGRRLQRGAPPSAAAVRRRITRALDRSSRRSRVD